MSEFEKILSGLVRVGTVTDRNLDKRLARVFFPDLNITSDWLPVLINRDRIGSEVMTWPETQWTEYETKWKGSRAGDPDYVDHKHELVIKPYMPEVGDQVLTVYLPVLDADGFVLGGIKPWK